MNRIFFGIVGVVCLVLVAINIFEYVNIVVRRIDEYRTPVETTVRVGAICLLLTAVGIGSLYARRWAAVLSSVFFTSLAIGLFYYSATIWYGRIWLIMFPLAILALLPLLGSIRYWKSLKPGGRWYL
jgi:hypothetical protein